MGMLASTGKLTACLVWVATGVSAVASEREARVVQIGLTLLNNRKVQRELALDRRQTDLIEREFKAYAAEAQRLFPRNMTKQQVAARMPQLRALQDGISGRVLGALTPLQVARFRQLVLQGEGIWAVLIPEATRELGLSAAQRRQIRSYRTEFGNKVQALERKHRSQIEAIPAPKDAKNKAAVEAYRKAVIALIKRNRDPDQRSIRAWGRLAVRKATKVLTRSQRAAWNRMLGPKFHPG